MFLSSGYSLGCHAWQELFGSELDADITFWSAQKSIRWVGKLTVDCIGFPGLLEQTTIN